MNNPYINALAIDRNTSTVYTGTNNGVFKSSDSGLIWIGIANTGLTNLQVRTLTIDPSNPAILYAGTGGGGVNIYTASQAPTPTPTPTPTLTPNPGSSTDTITYVYDALNRLTSVNYATGGSINYSYDAAGNRISIQVTGGATPTPSPTPTPMPTPTATPTPTPSPMPSSTVQFDQEATPSVKGLA